MVAALTVVMMEMGFSVHGIRHFPHDAVDARNDCPSPQEGHATNQNIDGLAIEKSDPRGQATLITLDARTRHDSKTACPVGSQETENGTLESSPSPLSHRQKEQRMILQCLLLEAGILFHSIFIGLSISISTGTTFIALMIAIAFHQMFEGLALGACVAAIPSFRISSIKPWLMSIAVRDR